MSGLTAGGFPYPEGDDPITDYPALAQLLAEEIDKRNRSAQGFSTAVATAAGGGFVLIPVGAVVWEDWAAAMTAADAKIRPEAAGRYRITSQFQWVGQTGGVGWSMGRIRHSNAAAAEQESAYGGMNTLNAGFQVVTIKDLLATDYLEALASSAAGAAGGSVYVRTTIERLK